MWLAPAVYAANFSSQSGRGATLAKGTRSRFRPANLPVASSPFFGFEESDRARFPSLPPSRAVAMPPALSAFASFRTARTPAFWASGMIGSTLAVVSILQADRVTLFELSGCLGGHARGADHSRVV